MGEEWDLLVRLAKRYKIGYISEALVDYNDGAHIRLTNVSYRQTITQLEDQLKAIKKHREFLGNYFFNYRIAWRYLSRISRRDDKINHIRYTIKTCGILPVVNVLCEKILRDVRKRSWLRMCRRN
jgi:hypothetical protein